MKNPCSPWQICHGQQGFRVVSPRQRQASEWCRLTRVQPHPKRGVDAQTPQGRPLAWSTLRCVVLSGDVLVSHTVPRAVPSALKGLTSGFGMEPGVSLSLWPPKLYGVISVTFIRPNLPNEQGVRSRSPTVTREPHSGRVQTLISSEDKPSAY